MDHYQLVNLSDSAHMILKIQNKYDHLRIRVCMDANPGNTDRSLSYVCEAFWKSIQNGGQASHVASLFLQRTNDIARKIQTNETTQREEEVVMKFLVALGAVSIETYNTDTTTSERNVGKETEHLIANNIDVNGNQSKTGKEIQPDNLIGRTKEKVSDTNLSGNEPSSRKNDTGGNSSLVAETNDDDDVSDVAYEDTDRSNINPCAERSDSPHVIGHGARNSDTNSSINPGDSNLENAKYSGAKNTDNCGAKKAEGSMSNSKNCDAKNTSNVDDDFEVDSEDNEEDGGGYGVGSDDEDEDEDKDLNSAKESRKSRREGSHVVDPSMDESEDTTNSKSPNFSEDPSTTQDAVESPSRDSVNQLVESSTDRQACQLYPYKNYVCNICKQEFTQNSTLVGHMEMQHKGNQGRKCKRCNIEFKFSGELNQHMGVFHCSADKHLNKQDKTCTLCRRQFKWQHNLKIHISKPHSHACSKCMMSFRSKRACLLHFKRAHPHENGGGVLPTQESEGEEDDIICTGKAKDQSKEPARASRLRVPEGLRCKLCGHFFKWRQNLNWHMKKVHKGTTEMLAHDKSLNKSDVQESNGNAKSDQREKSFKSVKYLKKHNSGMHATQEKCVCYICGLELKWKTSLKQHIEVIHEKVKRLMCDQCGKSFSYGTSLKTHILHEHGTKFSDLKNKKIHSCKVCSKVFCFASNLRKHEPMHKEGEFHCQICKGNFKLKGDLKNHIAVVHNKIKPHVCTVCGKGFSRKFGLMDHMRRIHEDFRRQFGCSICGKVLTTEKGLQDHLERHQRTPQQCDKCQKVYYTKGDLKRHSLKHSNDGWHCKQCGERFATSKLREGHTCAILNNRGDGTILGSQ